jgi:probable HAF family extracellular repeat protein
MKTILISIAGSALLAALAVAQSQPRYTVIDLDASDPFSSGAGINNAGSVGGSANLPGYTVQRAILWSHGRSKNLGSLGGPDSNSNGSVPNGRDEMAVLSETSLPDPFGEDFCYFGTHQMCRGAIWKDGALRKLSNLPGGNNSQATVMNNRSQVAGTAETNQRDGSCASLSPGQVFRFEAVVWQANGQIQQLRPPGSDTVGFTLGMNDLGQVVGSSGICANTSLAPLLHGPHAVLWENGTPRDLGSLSPGSMFNVAVTLNNRGEVVGGSKLASGDLHTFLWTRATGMHDLGVIDTDLGSAPGTAGINNSGQVVGVSCINDAGCNFFNPNFMGRAYLWQDGKMMDLNSLVVGGAPLYLASASGINDAGEIVGLAVDPSGTPHAFLAMPVRGESANESVSPATQSLFAPALSESARMLLLRQSSMHGR